MSLLIGILAVVVIAAVVLIVVLKSKTNSDRPTPSAGSQPATSLASLAPPLPPGFTSESHTSDGMATGTETLAEEAKAGPENGSTEDLQKAGWESGVRLEWDRTAHSGFASTGDSISISIEKFGTAPEATAYVSLEEAQAQRTDMFGSPKPIAGIPGGMDLSGTVGPPGLASVYVFPKGEFAVQMIFYNGLGGITAFMTKNLVNGQYLRIPLHPTSAG